MPFAERRKINMKKRKNLGKKLVTMLVSVGFFAVLITVLNLMALQAIRGKNNVLIEQFEQYEEAVKIMIPRFLKQQKEKWQKPSDIATTE